MNLLQRRTLGNQLQRGLMAVTGYFDGWGGPPYNPDWAVIAYAPTGDRQFPYRLECFNLNVSPGEYGHLTVCRLPEISWRYRFELCPGAEGPVS